MALQDPYEPFKKMMAKYYGNPSKEEVKKAAKDATKQTLNDPSVAIATSFLPIPGGQAVTGARAVKALAGTKVAGKAIKAVGKGLKTAAKAVGKAVGIGKPKSLAKSYDPTIPFKPDYKPPKTDIAESRGGRDYLTPAADRRIRMQEANEAYAKMMKQRQAELDAKIKSIRTDPRLSSNQREREVEKLMRDYKRENRGSEY